LRQDHIDAGKTLYEDAAEINFIQGRTIQSVAAVCLYVTCRLNKLPYLLLDFADAVQTNMFSLGQTYSQLLKKMPWLATKIPLIDPCFFMSRFCTKLDFGTKEKQVRELALRFIGSMNRAWISIGRRPNGLCGAAILIAARVVGFKRSPA
jgi:transcription factor IIIB 90 kDa subunit